MVYAIVCRKYCCIVTHVHEYTYLYDVYVFAWSITVDLKDIVN